jgi:hypothetical protein
MQQPELGHNQPTHQPATQMYPPPPPGFEQWGVLPGIPQSAPAQGWQYPPTYGMPYQKKGFPAWGWILVSAMAVVVFGCIAMTIIGLTIIEDVRKQSTEVTDSFLKAGRQRDVEKMYSLLSTQGKRNYSRATLQSILNRNSANFSGYNSLSIQDTDFTFNDNTIDATVFFIVTYDNGLKDELQVRTVEEPDGSRKISEFSFTGS